MKEQYLFKIKLYLFRCLICQCEHKHRDLVCRVLTESKARNQPVVWNTVFRSCPSNRRDELYVEAADILLCLHLGNLQGDRTGKITDSYLILIATSTCIHKYIIHAVIMVIIYLKLLLLIHKLLEQNSFDMI